MQCTSLAYASPHPTSPRRLQRQGCVSFSLKGEGLSAISRVEQFETNHFEDAVDVFRDVAVPETDDAVAVGLDDRRSLRIGFGHFAMLPTVELHDQFCGATGEIGDVWADRELENEFFALEPTATKMLPQPVLDLSAAATKFSGDWSQTFSTHGIYPSSSRQKVQMSLFSSTSFIRRPRISSSTVRLWHFAKFSISAIKSSGILSTTRSSFSSKRMSMTAISLRIKFDNNNRQANRSNAQTH